MPRPLLYLVGTFFGTGFAPFAPATVASFAWMLLWAALWRFVGPVALWVQAALLVVVTLVGIRVAGELEKIHGEDPKLVVIDEIAGMIVTYFALAATPLGWFAGFFWFRVFDILKPFGVRRLEQLGGGGGLGIMADDLGAGVLAAIATQVTVRLLGWTL
ncbi:MAG TPA: phosphatidylglycerophosphatase A [Candidatus Krumholzibacteria bacterium]|nr:phosphatidylglycerophosphatase A [Candidatus Krumholzibacteria bacterium]